MTSGRLQKFLNVLYILAPVVQFRYQTNNIVTISENKELPFTGSVSLCASIATRAAAQPPVTGVHRYTAPPPAPAFCESLRVARVFPLRRVNTAEFIH